MKITYKKEKRSRGLASIGEGEFVHIKLNGKKFGLISGGSAFNRGYTVQFAYKKSDGWDWKILTRNAKSFEAARIFAEGSIEEFAKNHEIHYFVSPQRTTNGGEK